MFAFTNAAGHRESDRISSADLKKDHDRAAFGRALEREAYRADLRRDKIQSNIQAEHGGLSSLTCGVCDPGSICVLQDRRRSEKAQGKHCLPEQAD